MSRRFGLLAGLALVAAVCSLGLYGAALPGLGPFRLSGSGSNLSGGSHVAHRNVDAMDRSWDFYARRGVLVRHGTRARFVPTDAIEGLARAGQTGLEKGVRLNDGYDELTKYTQAHAGSRQALTGLRYLHNKTVLLLGDSIDRFAVDSFCEELLPDSKLSIVNLHTAPHDLAVLSSSSADREGEPHICQLPNPPFGETRLISVLTHGVTAAEEEWQHKNTTRAPRETLAKLELLKSALDRQSIRPDLVIMHSVLWDMATVNNRDVLAEATASDTLDLAFLSEFRGKTARLFDTVHAMWPEAARMYRLGHDVTTSSGWWFMEGMPEDLQRIPRRPFTNTKVRQLNSAVLDVIESEHREKKHSPVWPLNLPHAMQGFMQDYRDNIHMGRSGQSLHLQMILYYLKHRDRLRQ